MQITQKYLGNKIKELWWFSDSRKDKHYHSIQQAQETHRERQNTLTDLERNKGYR